MMRYTFPILILLLTTALQSPAQTKPSTYIGYTYEGVNPGKSLPNGVTHLGGGLLGDIDAEKVYGISQVQRGRTKMLWLEVSTGKDARGITGWRVLDVLTFSTLPRSRYVFFHSDPAVGCRRKGETNDLQNLVGEGKIVWARGVFIPSNLWTANLGTGKFESLALTGISCGYSEP